MRSEKGQVSVEVLLIVGAILLIVLSVHPAISEQTELTRGVTAARDGAAYATNIMGLGFTESGSGIRSANKTIQIVGMDYAKGGKVDGKTSVVITFELRGTNNDTAIGAAIADYSLKFIYKAFNGDYNIGAGATYVDSDAHRFNTSYIFT